MKEFIKGNERDLIQAVKKDNHEMMLLDVDNNLTKEQLYKVLHELENEGQELFMLYDELKNNWAIANLHPKELVYDVKDINDIASYYQHNKEYMLRFFVAQNQVMIIINRVIADVFGFLQLIELFLLLMHKEVKLNTIKFSRFDDLKQVITKQELVVEPLSLHQPALKLPVFALANTKEIQSQNLILSNETLNKLIDQFKVDKEIILTSLIIYGLFASTLKANFSLKLENNLRKYFLQEYQDYYTISNLSIEQDLNVFEIDKGLNNLILVVKQEYARLDNTYYKNVHDIIDMHNTLSIFPKSVDAIAMHLISHDNGIVSITNLDYSKYKYLSLYNAKLLGRIASLPNLYFNVNYLNDHVEIISYYYKNNALDIVEQIYTNIQNQINNILK